MRSSLAALLGCGALVTLLDLRCVQQPRSKSVSRDLALGMLLQAPFPTT